MASVKKIDWERYGTAYDLMCNHNNYYQSLLKVIRNDIGNIVSNSNDPLSLAELCSGTGNIVINLASSIPFSRIDSYELHDAFISRQRHKIKENSLESKIQVIQQDILSPLPSVKYDIIVMVHALNFFSSEQRKTILSTIHSHLNDYGHLVIGDIGRKISLFSWAPSLLCSIIKENPFTFPFVLKQMSPVILANKVAGDKQTAGESYVHNLSNFVSYLRQNGFNKIVYSRDDLYKGIDDYVIVQKNT
jgi:ubiquinone/menaquinone biosynthesis C-methylase UbiE